MLNPPCRVFSWPREASARRETSLWPLARIGRPSVSCLTSGCFPVRRRLCERNGAARPSSLRRSRRLFWDVGPTPPTSVLSGANVATPVFSVNCCATRGARVLCVFSACPSGLARKQGLEYPKLAGSAAICHVQVQGWGGGRSGLGPLNSPGPKTQS